MVSIEKRSRTRLAAGAGIDFSEARESLRRLGDTVHQEPRVAILDDLAARAEIHRHHWYAGGIGLRQNQTESLGDSVQMQQRSRPREQSVLAWYVDRADIADCRVEVRFHLLAEVFLVLNNARDEQRQSAQAGNLDCQMDALIRVNAA